MPSPNYDWRDGHEPRAIVMHIAAGSIEACDEWLTNPASDASAHYCVARDGRVRQYVAEERAAWANGVVNAPTIDVSEGDPNKWTISIEHEGATGDQWTDAMYAADVELLRGISGRWGIPLDRAHVIPHSAIDSINRAHCPGAGLDWERLLREANMVKTALVNPFRRGYIVHGGPNGEYPIGRPEHWQKWISEIKAMGFDGVKVLVFESANAPDKQPIQAIKALLDAGLVVVARLFRERPNPGRLTNGQLDVARLLISMGVRFVETNNEPNLQAEWQGNAFSDMARERVAADWLADATQIVALGGYPAIPAMAPGGNLDDGWFLEGILREIKRLGVTDHVLAHSWLSIHNYSLNHPLNYPFDDVNRNGTPLTQAEYDAQGPFTLPLEQVNAERAKGKHPNPNIMEAGESNGFYKFDMVHKLALDILDIDMPVISTEGGAVMDRGFSNDPRYPLVMDEGKHAAINVERAQRMMRGEVPAFFWADCMWVIANRMMENPAQAGFEAHSWYPYWKTDGVKVVADFKAMPKQDRPVSPVVPPEEPEEPADSAVVAMATAVANSRMATFPWGDKFLLKRGLLPFGDQWPSMVEGRLWWCRAGFAAETGKTYLCTFPDGGYTDGETILFPWQIP